MSYRGETLPKKFFTIESAPDSDTNHEWCDGCGEHGKYRRITHSVDGVPTCPAWVSWLCDACVKDENAIVEAYHSRTPDAEAYATEADWSLRVERGACIYDACQAASTASASPYQATNTST